MKKKSATVKVWNALMGEVKVTLGEIGKATILRPTWKESFKLLRQAVLPALFERFVGLVIVGVLIGVAYLFLQLIIVLSGGPIR